MRARYQKGSVAFDARVKSWWFRWREGGRRMSERLGSQKELPTKADAERAAFKLRARVNGLAQPVTVTVRYVAERYMAERMSTRYSTSRASRSRIGKHILPFWGDRSLTEVKPYAVDLWLKNLLLSAKTKSHLKSHLRQLFECAMLWEYLPTGRNPMDLVVIKGATKRARKQRMLTVEEFHSIMTKLTEPHQTMVLLAGCLGLTCSELFALKWADVDWQNLAIYIRRGVVAGREDATKTDAREATVPLDPALAEALLRWRRQTEFVAESDWMFASPASAGEKPYFAWGIQRRFLRPLGIGWHTLRHAYRTWLDATGAPIGVQQKLMRHADIRTTMNIYGDALDQSKREANAKVVKMVMG